MREAPHAGGGYAVDYPIEKEKALRSMILTHDKLGAQNALNELIQ